ncbi:tRNA delta(2)-isopentenylpyrophosphate transferase [Neisseria elongata subsp. glycolytica ATCC 29315]|uniref:tRNA dimethylallyltransferase n=1 Tax=Neisseria elongata subsp. glycolytica ATCC 29315 TaxID=546263 RepID=D4DQF4_NEIEG|nr:tRNA (adenosine(37)-N6)-dimethylallyltransferase MiaA [Neisseria elongata]AJE18805.1 tRNA delta(2)-isopentenylpyrophosphate transferase [Neisseria elongata subsp. glycolytica ATCC 29315]EFE50037.1 tRNA dimethylallyltransferase [Neisseria elongata subsp. glycolytica ATCC 29315]SQH50696.1 tRNA delta(2)-isopentenylpyrophosphate transferase [Neisseria elongata subsp. glycolytica]
MDFPKAFAVLGPTAGGKTGLALRLAQRFPLEIISLDSALVYREMDIGTAKPTAEELASVPHHLIDIISPLQSYSAAEFAADCLRLCGEISARGRMPLIVGGTMMYFHALVNGLNDLPQADAGVRAQLQAQKAEQGLEGLYRRLCEVDAATAARLKPGDSQRIERALEVFLLTGRPLSDHLAVQTAYRVPLRLHTLVLFPQRRELLHEAIARRFRLMLEQGFIEEVGRLKAEYPSLTAEHNSMRCVGYRQAWDYLDGACAYNAFVDAGIAATRQLAKRQLTWLRKTEADTLLDPYDGADVFQTASAALERHFS